MTWLFGIPGKIKLYLAMAGAVVLAIAAAFLKGWSARGRQEQTKDLRDYKETRERMDDAETNLDPDDARNWLRERGKR